MLASLDFYYIWIKKVKDHVNVHNLKTSQSIIKYHLDKKKEPSDFKNSYHFPDNGSQNKLKIFIYMYNL